MELLFFLLVSFTSAPYFSFRLPLPWIQALASLLTRAHYLHTLSSLRHTVIYITGRTILK